MSVARVATSLKTLPTWRTLAVPALKKGGVPIVFRRHANVASPEETYTAKQARKGRPVSPHLTIYAFPPSAITSIMVRITGVVMSGGLSVIAGTSLAGYNPVDLMNAIHDYPALLALSKVAVTFPVTYHYLAAVRHWYWDNEPATLTVPDVERTNYYLLGATGAVVAAALAV